MTAGMKSLCLNRENTLAVVCEHLDPETLLRHLQQADQAARVLSVEEGATIVSAQVAQEETGKLSKSMRLRASRISPLTAPSPLVCARARDTGALALAAVTSRDAPAPTHARAFMPRRRAMPEHLSGRAGPQDQPPSATPPRQLRMKQRAQLDDGSPRARLPPRYPQKGYLVRVLSYFEYQSPDILTHVFFVDWIRPYKKRWPTEKIGRSRTSTQP